MLIGSCKFLFIVTRVSIFARAILRQQHGFNQAEVHKGALKPVIKHAQENPSCTSFGHWCNNEYIYIYILKTFPVRNTPK